MNSLATDASRKNKFPDELWQQTLAALPLVARTPLQLCALAGVCKQMRRVVREDALWQLWVPSKAPNEHHLADAFQRQVRQMSVDDLEALRTSYSGPDFLQAMYSSEYFKAVPFRDKPLFEAATVVNNPKSFARMGPQVQDHDVLARYAVAMAPKDNFVWMSLRLRRTPTVLKDLLSARGSLLKECGTATKANKEWVRMAVMSAPQAIGAAAEALRHDQGYVMDLLADVMHLGLSVGRFYCGLPAQLQVLPHLSRTALYSYSGDWPEYSVVGHLVVATEELHRLRVTPTTFPELYAEFYDATELDVPLWRDHHGVKRETFQKDDLLCAATLRAMVRQSASAADLQYVYSSTRQTFRLQYDVRGEEKLPPSHSASEAKISLMRRYLR